MMFQKLGFLSLFVGLSTLFDIAIGQEIGSELCSCAPADYRFSFEFGLTCPPVNVTRGDGIALTVCQISPFGDPGEEINDLVPVQVDVVNILELAQDFTVLSQKNLTGAFFDGDTISYESILSEEEPSSGTEIPKVIQVNIFATNAAGQPIVNFFAISFTNACDGFPLFDQGNTAGWLRFAQFSDPPRGFCPIADTPTSSPTSLPLPTSSPTSLQSPTETPSIEGVKPSPSPTVAVSPVPTMSMSMMMDMDMSMMMDMDMSMDMSMSLEYDIEFLKEIGSDLTAEFGMATKRKFVPPPFIKTSQVPKRKDAGYLTGKKGAKKDTKKGPKKGTKKMAKSASSSTKQTKSASSSTKQTKSASSSTKQTKSASSSTKQTKSSSKNSSSTSTMDMKKQASKKESMESSMSTEANAEKGEKKGAKRRRLRIHRVD